jgi:ribosomal protein S12 methylthiotransferase
VPEETRQARRARFMAVQAEISAMRLRARIGTTIDVLVDRIDDGIAVARGPGDAPEIDGVVRIDDARGITAGAFVRVRITDSDAHDLVGVPVSAESAATAPAGARSRGPARDRRGSSRTPG